MASTPGIRDALARKQTLCSFEFFPSKNGPSDPATWDALRQLEQLRPDFVSVTYGAGGSTQERTLGLVSRIQHETSLNAVAHLTCVGATKDDLRAAIAHYAAEGVRSVLALRGDPVAGPNTPFVPHPGGFTHAVELVELIRELGEFTIGVAAFPEKHPESPSMKQDARVLADKQRAGADYAITQLFFRPLDYFELVDRAAAAGATLPIIPGVLPITNVAQIERFTSMAGTTIPKALLEQFDRIRHDEHAVRELGVEVAAELCMALLAGGAPGIHFFTMNRARATQEVFARLLEAGVLRRDGSAVRP